MYAKNAANIKGLGIAAVVLSIAILLCCLLCFALIGVTGAVFGDGAFADRLAHELNHGYGYDYFDGYGMSLGIMSLALSITGILVGWELIGCLVSLVAGIIAIRGSNNIAKYGSIFCWSIAGAVAALLGGRLITMGLLIVAAVFANKDKSAAETAQYNQGNATFTQPGYVQNSVSQDPFYTAYGVGHAQPQAAPAQGVAVPPSYQQQTYPQPYPQPTAGYQQTYCQPVASEPVATQAVAEPAIEAQVAAEDASAEDKRD